MSTTARVEVTPSRRATTEIRVVEQGAVPDDVDAVAVPVAVGGPVPAELALDLETLAQAGFTPRLGASLAIPRGAGPALVAMGARWKAVFSEKTPKAARASKATGHSAAARTTDSCLNRCRCWSVVRRRHCSISLPRVSAYASSARTTTSVPAMSSNDRRGPGAHLRADGVQAREQGRRHRALPAARPTLGLTRRDWTRFTRPESSDTGVVRRTVAGAGSRRRPSPEGGQAMLGLRRARRATPMRMKTIPSPMAIAAMPKLTTLVNRLARRKLPFMTVARTGSSRSSSA